MRPCSFLGARVFQVTFLICVGYLAVSTALYLWTKDTGRPLVDIYLFQCKEYLGRSVSCWKRKVKIP